MEGRGGRGSATTKTTNKVLVKCFSLKGTIPFHNMSLPSPTLLSMDVLTHVYPLLKHLFSKIFPMAKTCSTCLKTTYKRSKCLVLSRRVQDPSATRTEANVFPKTSTMEQISETTDRLGSERDVVEGFHIRKENFSIRYF